MSKSWAEYLLEALGAGLIAGALFAIVVAFRGDATTTRIVVLGVLGFALGVGLRLASGRASVTKKDL